MSLRVVKPLTIVPAMLLSTDVPESDYAPYSAATTYELGARCIVVSDHAVYESLVAGNVGSTPATSPAKWVRVSATNRWKLFDLVNSSRTVRAASLFYEIKPGAAVNALAVLNLSGATSIRIRVTDPVYGLVYDRSTTLISAPAFASWYDWFYADRVSDPQHVALDLPSFPAATIRVDLTGDSSLGVGTLLLGQAKAIAETRYGSRVGIRDYSRKESNEWGDVDLVQRAFARVCSLPAIVPHASKWRTAQLLDSLRATPTLWIAVDDDSLLTVFGWYRDYEILISYPTFSELSLEIEGLT
ncbi:carbohydrate-binding protein [Rhodocyclus tenuis]|uniref:Carbohydrate-binding protein n=1 Tax=Rhodocyclus tenuis TaxID=1066 RepID=A0A840GIV5_RHOTE|nr:carbohydrate-binding protein [Rhodocyclus tenuis]MBB4248392.1 hypothetical protein [Rhodocyclus tenuis]